MSPSLDQNIDAATIRLIKLILDLPSDQRLQLLKQAEAMASPSSDENERDTGRKPFTASLSFYLDNITHNGKSRDVSAGGMFIETILDVNAVKIGDVITIDFPRSQKEGTVKVPARIVRIIPEGIGVEFIKKAGG